MLRKLKSVTKLYSTSFILFFHAFLFQSYFYFINLFRSWVKEEKIPLFSPFSPQPKLPFFWLWLLKAIETKYFSFSTMLRLICWFDPAFYVNSLIEFPFFVAVPSWLYFHSQFEIPCPVLSYLKSMKRRESHFSGEKNRFLKFQFFFRGQKISIFADWLVKSIKLLLNSSQVTLTNKICAIISTNIILTRNNSSFLMKQTKKTFKIMFQAIFFRFSYVFDRQKIFHTNFYLK